jgi:hypothetical protein
VDRSERCEQRGGEGKDCEFVHRVILGSSFLFTPPSIARSSDLLARPAQHLIPGN